IDPFIYNFSMDFLEHSALGGLASLRVDFDRSAGDTAAGRLYAAFGTYGHINLDVAGPTAVWVPTNASPSNYVFKFDVKTRTEGAGFTRTRLLMVITDDHGQKGKPDAGIADFKGSMEIEDGIWQTIAIPLGTNFFNWSYPEGQDGSLVTLDFSRIKQLEFCPWVGREDKRGVMWLDNLRIETVNGEGHRYPVAVARQNGRLIGTNETVQLSGAESYDPDGSIVAWSWSPAEGLSDAQSVAPIFTPAGPGVYTFELTVTDSQGLKSRNPAQAIIQCQPTLYPSDIRLYRDEQLSDEIVGVASNCLDIYVKLICFAGGNPEQKDFTMAGISSSDVYGPDDHNNTGPIQIVLEETENDSLIFTGRLRLSAFSDENIGSIGALEGSTLSVSNNGYFVSRTIGPQTYGLQTVIDHIEDGTDKFNTFDGVWNTYDDRPNGNSSVVSMASSLLGATSNSTQSIFAEGTLHLVTATNFNQLFAGLMTKLTPYSNDIAEAVSDLSGTTGCQGISFWLRGNGKRLGVVLKSLSISNYDDYVYNIEHTPTGGWRRYQIPFSDFEQEGWGNRAVEREEALRHVNAIQFKFASKVDGEVNRIYVDDLMLFGGTIHLLPHVIYNKKNTISMEGFDGGFITNKTFEGPGAPGWTLTGNAVNEDWGNWRMVLENWSGTFEGSAWQEVAIQSGKAYQFSIKAWKNAGFNGQAYMELAWYNAASIHLGTDSLNITPPLTEVSQTCTLPWRWAPDGAARVRVRVRTDGGAPPYTDNGVQFDDAEFSEYGFVADNGWIGSWIAGASLESSSNRAEGEHSMCLKSSSSNWLAGMFVAPYDTGDTRTNFGAFSGFALKACRPEGFTNTGRAAGRIRLAVATNEDPVARTRWYSVGASAWEDYILFPKDKFLTADSVDSNDPSAWTVWSNDWTGIRRIIIEYGPSREAFVPYHVLVDDFRPYADTYVPDDIEDEPITNSMATTNRFSIYHDAGIAPGT
ncbi:MAG: CIA30 family protein, partial [Lentisphaerota bacterium]